MYNYFSILLLLRFSIDIIFLYPFVHFILSLNTIYNNYDYNKKCYIVKNIIKSVILCYISLFSITDIFIPIYHDKWDNYIINKYASLYVANDIVSLFIIPKLPKTTKFHHITTTILLLFSFSIDFQQNNVGRWLFIYCVFSSFSFLVNLYLGLRHIKETNNIVNRFTEDLRVIAYYVYFICCAINWSIHIYLFISNIYDLNTSHFVYILLLVPIINDDLILLSWLKGK